LLKKFGLTEEDVKLRPIGGSQSERYNAMAQDVIQAIIVTPPLDVRGKRDGFNLVYNLNDLKLPFIYSSVHTNSKMIQERPQLAQRVVAAFAEAVYFVEKNPDKAKASVSKALVNRRLLVPGDQVADAVELAKAETAVRKKPSEIYDNRFAEDLEKSGFLKELWGGKVP